MRNAALRRLSLSLALALCAFVCAPALAFADDAPKKDALPEEKGQAMTLASDEEVAEALKAFKENFKAKGLPKEDKVAQRDFAMQQIAPLQHADVIAALGKVTRSSDPDLRMLAMIYIGDQKALPHLASKYILAAMKKGKKNTATLMTGLQSLGSLKYLGARKQIADLLKHRDFAVKKEAIAAIGNVRDIRMLTELMQIIGMKVETESGKESKKTDSAQPDKKESQKETVEEGYSWEGAEATVDRGEADNTQENADAKKQAEAQIAANKAAAAAAAGGGGEGMGGSSGAGSSGLGGGGASGGRGGSSRSTEELHPAILSTLKKLTGQEFEHPGSIKKWLAVNRKAVVNNMEHLNNKEAAQKKAK